MQNQLDPNFRDDQETVERGQGLALGGNSQTAASGAVQQLDLWDLGQAPERGPGPGTGASLAASYGETRAIDSGHLYSSTTDSSAYLQQRASSSALWAIFGLLCLWVGFGVLVMSQLGPSFADRISQLFQGTLFSAESGQQAGLTAGTPDSRPALVENPIRVTQIVNGNPYWSLDNRVPQIQQPLKRRWSPIEQKHFADRFASDFVYQQWQVVKDLRELRFRGGEELLYQATAASKFWTRMEAAFALAEMGKPVSESDMEKVIGQARSDLVARYFQRIQRDASPGELYVTRQAIRLLDERGRLAALQTLDKNPDPWRDLYMVAASYDPGPAVQKWAQEQLQWRPIDPERLTYLRRVVDGYELFRPDTQKPAHSAEDEQVYQAEVEVQSVPVDSGSESIIMYDSPESNLDNPTFGDGFEALEAVEI